MYCAEEVASKEQQLVVVAVPSDANDACNMLW